MAMARTVFSPRCWATSNTRRNSAPVFWSVLVVSSALWMAGRWPSNSTSTTAPMICTRRPVATAWPVAGPGAAFFGAAGLRAAGFLAVAASDMAVSFDFRLERFGAGDDLDQLLGDLRLACTVILLGEGGDHVAGIAGRIVHRGHLRGVEAGLVFQRGREDLGRDVARQQLGKDGFLVGL